MATETVTLELGHAVATLCLNRPAVRNALSSELVDQLATHLTTLEGRDDVRALVLTGAGRGFSAGADLAEISRGSAADAAQIERHTAAVFDRMAALPMPVLAALHGFAVGGGFFLSLYADVRIVAAGTKLGFPAVARQWIPPWALSRLAGWVGVRRAEQILLSQSMFTPRQAVRWGLAERVVAADKLLAVARDIAAHLAETPREVTREIREFFAALRGFEHARWDEVANAGFERRFSSPEAQSAMRAFFAKSSER